MATKDALVRSIVRMRRGPYFYDCYLNPRVSASDVYLMCYPRSGSTWVRCLLTSYAHDTEVTPDLVYESVPSIYRVDLTVQPHTDREIGVFRSHSKYVSIPAKIIYLVRDGRDAVLSWYWFRYHAEGPDGFARTVSSRDFFFLDKKFGPWHEHVLGWLQGLETWPADRYMILRYEDLVADPERHLSAIVEFVGLPFDLERVERAVAWNGKSALAEFDRRDPGALAFQGVTKQRWRDVLSDEDLARYEAVAGQALIRAGYPLCSTRPLAPCPTS